MSNEDTNWDRPFRCYGGHEPNLDACTSVLGKTTEKTEFAVACAQAGSMDQATWKTLDAPKATGLSAVMQVPQAQVVFHKHVGLVSSLHAAANECPAEALKEARDGRTLGYEEERAQHAAAWADIWALDDIRIEGDVEAQQAIRFKIFHLNQTYRGDDARLTIGHKGVTGEE